MASKIQIRRDTASNWTSADPTLSNGELGIETDTKKLKVGDGSTAWSSLAYYTLGTVGYITATSTDTLSNKTLTAPKFVDAGFIADANGAEQIIFQTTASAVNQFDVTNAATSNAPKLSSTGGDSNIDLDLEAKGTGHVTVRGNTNAGAIQFNCESNSHGVLLKGPPHSASATYSLELPNAVGSSGDFLKASDGSGKLTFAALALSDLSVTATATELNKLDGVTATTTELNYVDITALGTTEASKAVTADANGVVTFDNGKIEESTAITSSSNAATINLRDGDNFTHTLTENVTYTFSNPAASGKVSAFTLKVIQDSSARTITWPGSVDWAAATAPTLTATSGGVDVFVFVTYDGGTNYYGFTAGQAMG